MIAIQAYLTIRGLWLERAEMDEGLEDASYPEFLAVVFRALLPLPNDLPKPKAIIEFVRGQAGTQDGLDMYALAKTHSLGEFISCIVAYVFLVASEADKSKAHFSAKDVERACSTAASNFHKQWRSGFRLRRFDQLPTPSLVSLFNERHGGKAVHEKPKKLNKDSPIKYIEYDVRLDSKNPMPAAQLCFPHIFCHGFASPYDPTVPEPMAHLSEDDRKTLLARCFEQFITSTRSHKKATGSTRARGGKPKKTKAKDKEKETESETKESKAKPKTKAKVKSKAKTAVKKPKGGKSNKAKDLMDDNEGEYDPDATESEQDSDADMENEDEDDDPVGKEVQDLVAMFNGKSEEKKRVGRSAKAVTFVKVPKPEVCVSVLFAH